MARPEESWFGWMHGRKFRLKADSHKPDYKKGDVVKAVMVSRMGDVGVTHDLTADRGYDLRLMPYQLEPVDPIPGNVCELCHFELGSGDHKLCTPDRKCDKCQGPTGPGDPVCPTCCAKEFVERMRDP